MLVGSLSPAFAGRSRRRTDADDRVLSPGADPPVCPPRRDAASATLLDEAREQFDARRKAIAAIKTPEDIARAAEGAACVLRRLAGRPARADAAQSARRRDAAARRVTASRRSSSRAGPDITSRPISTFPDGKPPFPGVLVPCGHSDNGKAAEAYQRACILLAKNGMAVLCYDPIGQGERFQLLDAQGKPVIRGTTEHTMAGIGALLVGRQAASYRIWDGIRGLDYLASRPEVDPERLGCTGNSGGGTMTAYLMALDDRIAVAAPSCYITSLERLFATIGPQDAEQNITGQVAAGMEHADYITMRAPKPTLAVRRHPRLLRHPGELGHVPRGQADLRPARLRRASRPVRVGRAARLHPAPARGDRPLDDAVAARRQDDAVDRARLPDRDRRRPAMHPERPGADAISAGSVRFRPQLGSRESAAGSLRPFSIAQLSKAEFRGNVIRQLDLRGWHPKALQSRLMGSRDNAGTVVRKLTFGVAPQLSIPAIEITGVGQNGALPTLVKIGADWQKEMAQAAKLIGPGAAHGRLVLVNPRGMGETTPDLGQGRNDFLFGADWREAFLALHLDQTLLGRRVADVLTVLESLAAEPGANRDAGFEVVGFGPAGLVVLHAALLDERGLIKKIEVERSLVSWSDVIDRKVSRGQLASVVPSALTLYDLPDLAARLAPLPLAIHNAVDAMGQPVSQATLEQAYAECTRAYGAGGALSLRAAGNAPAK